MKSLYTKRIEAAERREADAEFWGLRAERATAKLWPDIAAKHARKAEIARRDAANARANAAQMRQPFIPWDER